MLLGRAVQNALHHYEILKSRLTSSILLCFDLCLQVFWVHILVVLIVLWWFTLSTAETTAATTAATREDCAAHDHSLSQGDRSQISEGTLKKTHC